MSFCVVSQPEMQLLFELSMLNAWQGRIQTIVQQGAPTPSRGCLSNISIKFSEKPYQIKEILVGRWGPLTSATAWNITFKLTGIARVFELTKVSHVSNEACLNKGDLSVLGMDIRQ